MFNRGMPRWGFPILRRACAPAAVLLLGAAPAHAQETDDEPGDAGPFRQGAVDLTVRLGSAAFGSSEYLIVGAAGGYYVLDGLAVGLDASIWLFGDPLVGTLTPELKYVLHYVPVVKPYVGSFVRRYLIGDDYADFTSVGGRVGANVPSGSGYYGGGVVYERVLDCAASRRRCDDWYPELVIALSF